MIGVTFQCSNFLTSTHRTDYINMTYVKQSHRKSRNPGRSRPIPPTGQLFARKPNTHLNVGLFQIKGFKDQNGKKWVGIHRPPHTAVVPYQGGNEGALWTALGESDVVVASGPTKTGILEAIESTSRWPEEVYAVTAPGFHRDAFVKPDGTVIGKPSAKRFQVNLDTQVALGKAGTFEKWQSLVATHVQGQPVFVLALCASFVGPVLEMIGGANVCIDLNGPTSTGKTTALDLFASAWGAPLKSPGSLGVSLRATANGLEQHVLARTGSAFPADEVSLLGKDVRQQGDILFEIAFMLAEGVPKERFNDLAHRRAILSCMITSNTPLPSLLQHSDPAQLKGVLVRWISVPADAGPEGLQQGVIDHVPRGFANSGEAIADLKARLAVNYGHAADIFLARLLRDARRKKPKVKRHIERYKLRFLRATQVEASDKEAWRLAQHFAIVCAVGQLAAKWGIIPVKGIKAALVECYRRSAPISLASPPTRPTAVQRVLSYVEASKGELVDLDETSYRRRKKAQLNALPGWLKTVKGRRCLVIRAMRWEAEFGVDARSMLRELQRDDLLVVQKKGLQVQTRIRKNRAKDRVYAIALTRPKK